MSALIATARSFLAVGQPGCERNRKYDLKTIGQVCSSYFSLGTERRTMAGWRSTRPTPRPLRARSLGSEQDEDGDLEESRQQLARMMGEEPLTGAELRRLVFEKFNRTYDVRLQRRGKRMYLHIMWKFLEQKSFPLTEEEYDMQLQAVAEYITMWGVADQVRAGIKAAKWAPGHTIGGGAKAFQIPLGVEVGSGGRSSEWNSF